MQLIKIAKTMAALPLKTPTDGSRQADRDRLDRLSLSESWSADFESGAITLSRWSALMHGLSAGECGLLTLMRCYEPGDRAHALAMFEEAAERPSSFCFSTSILQPGGLRQPVFCMGQSILSKGGAAGGIEGIFLFPRFKAGSTVEYIGAERLDVSAAGA